MQFLDQNLSFWEEAMRGLFASLCQLIYPLIAWLYSLFINISNVNILSEDTVAPIYQRVTMLLTIIMVFYVTFQFVKFVVQPDEITDKEKGTAKIIYKMIIVVVLIAFVPKLFAGAFWMQGKIMNNDLIGKVIIGQAMNESKGPDEFGRIFSANIFSLFYKFEPDESKGIAEDAECGDIECKQVITLNLNFLRDKGDLTYLTLGLNESTEIDTPLVGDTEDMALITFNYLMATGVGIFVAYMLVLYCIDAGARWAQLVFLQIIAPIPIIGYLTPKKDGIFQKWVKQCITTYLDLFIRMGIIYFVLLVCQILTNSLSDGTLFAGLDGLSTWMKNFVYIALILGLMMFAKKAPKMLEELFPKTGAASGSFGLKAGERFSPVADLYKGTKGFFGKTFRPIGRIAGAVSGAAIGAAAGLATGVKQGLRKKDSLDKDGNKRGGWAGAAGAAWGGIRGTFGGATRGVYNGAKKGNVFKNSVEGAKKQIESNKKYGNRVESGYTLGHQVEDRFRNTFGMKSRVEAVEAEKAPISRHDEALKKVADTRKSIEQRALDKMADGKGGAMAQVYADKQQQLKNLQEHGNALYKVSKYKDADTAQKAYESAVTNAKSSVIKSNFIDPTTGMFDKLGYEKAVKAAESMVDVNDYMVAYKTDAEALAAYNDAVQKKVDAVDKTKFIDPTTGILDVTAYNAAKNKATAEVNKDMFQKGYATQEEADAALGADIKRLQGEVDKAKDAAVDEYVREAKDDGAIDSMLTELSKTINEYNLSANAETEIKDAEGKVIANGRKIQYTDDISTGAISASKIRSNFQAFSDEVKKGQFKKLQDANTNEIIGIDAEINRIKRETEGSGINEGKK